VLPARGVPGQLFLLLLLLRFRLGSRFQRAAQHQFRDVIVIASVFDSQYPWLGLRGRRFPDQ
jgi:hypothetical protein